MKEIEKVKKYWAKTGVVYGVYIPKDFVYIGVNEFKFIDELEKDEKDITPLIKYRAGFYLKIKNKGQKPYYIPMSDVIEFTEEQMKMIPEDRLIYQGSGYDQAGYYQAGFLYGTMEELDGCEFDSIGVITRISDYIKKYGMEICRDILHKNVNIKGGHYYV